MRRGNLLAARVIGLAVAVTLAVLLTWWPGAAQGTQASCDWVRVGMTLAEAKALLGEPSDLSRPVDLPADARTGTWRGREGTITLTFDESGRVTAKRWQPLPPDPDEEPSGLSEWFWREWEELFR